MSDLELLTELGVEAKVEKKASRTPREERIIAGFEEIQRFVEEHGEAPIQGENQDIFERIYAKRLDRIRELEECRNLVEESDHQGLLDQESKTNNIEAESLDDEELLAELGIEPSEDSDVTKLKHVKPRAEIRAAEEVARHIPCSDFEDFKPLFLEVQKELEDGVRKTRIYENDAEIKQGEFFILAGQKIYVAVMGEEYINKYDRPDRRLRVIYDNGTESNILYRSLQRALNKDGEGKKGRRISDPEAGPLFSDEKEDGDMQSGIIYVLRSKSEHPEIKENYEVLHKIGVTGGDIRKRIANAKDDPTFLMADVEVVASYNLSNINRVKLEKLIHNFFEPARLNIKIKDRFGKPIAPREWFLVPLSVINEMVEHIKASDILYYRYDPLTASLSKSD